VSAPGIGEIAFRPVAAGDLPMLGEWMARPHWQDWWGEPQTELGYVRDMIEGRDPTCLPYLFMIGGEPAGYIQVWQIAPHQTPDWAQDSPWLMELPADAVGVDLSLADGGSLSRGIGSAVLRRFAEDLTAQGHETIIIDPDPGNARAIAAYRKAGFRPIPGITGGAGKALIMQFHPDMALQ
jgi:RimJ/RimL family protein N-acetyltransferase